MAIKISGTTVIDDSRNLTNLGSAIAITQGGTGATTAAGALTALGAYAASNPSGYTTNTGTVTSVGGTGTVSGLTLTGTVTGSGNLTLGGTLSLTSGQVTTALGFTPYNSTNPSGYITSSGSITGSSRYVNLLDTRATDDQPQGKVGYNLSLDFKNNTAASNPPATASGTYSHVLTVAGWDTNGGSGGWPSQLSTGDGIAVRQALSATAWGPWRTVLHSNNYTSYSPSLTGSGASGSWGINVTGTAASISGYNNPTTAATANTIVYRDANGDDYRRYGFSEYLNMSHGASGATGDTVFYSSADNYIRKNNATGFRASLNVPTRTGGDASGTWGISITGSAANVTGTVAVANGGTGTTALTANNVILGNGTSAVQVVAPGTSGNVLTSNGTTWTSVAATGGAGSGGAAVSGSVTLTSASGGAQTITPTDYNQFVRLPSATTMSKAAGVFSIRNAGNFPLRVLNNSSELLGFVQERSVCGVDLADNTTAAGVWQLSNAPFADLTVQRAFTGLANMAPGMIPVVITIDADRDLYIWYPSGDTGAVYGVVNNKTTGAWGTATLIRATTGITQYFRAVADPVTVGKVLFVLRTSSSVLGTGLLTITGTTISVGVVNTTDVGATPFGFAGDIVAMTSTSFVLPVNLGGSWNLIGISISGTESSIGATPATSGYNQSAAGVFPISSTLLVFIGSDTTNCYARTYNVSGNSVTTTTLVATGSGGASIRVLPISSGARWVVIAADDTSTSCHIFRVSGSTPAVSSVTLDAAFVSRPATNATFQVIGNKAIICYINPSLGRDLYFDIVTDTAGTASKGTRLGLLNQNYFSSSITAVSSIFTQGNFAYFGARAGGNQIYYKIDCSGASPTIAASNLLQNSNASIGEAPFLGSNVLVSSIESQRTDRLLLNSTNTFGVIVPPPGTSLSAYITLDGFNYVNSPTRATAVLSNNQGRFFLGGLTGGNNTSVFYLTRYDMIT